MQFNLVFDSMESMESTALSPHSLGEDLRNMWSTRPVRIPGKQGGNSIFAGVSYGIAARFQVSPLLIRVGFVMIALLGGAGIFLYLLAWAFMPRFSAPASPIESLFRFGDDGRLKSERRLGIILIIAMIIFVPSSIFPDFSAAGPIFIRSMGPLSSIALAFVAWWLLYKRTPIPPLGLFCTDNDPTQSSTDSSSHTPAAEAPTVDLSRITPISGYESPYWKAIHESDIEQTKALTWTPLEDQQTQIEPGASYPGAHQTSSMNYPSYTPQYIPPAELTPFQKIMKWVKYLFIFFGTIIVLVALIALFMYGFGNH